MCALHKKHFSLEDARAVLPEILPLVEELNSLNKALVARGFDISRHEYFGGSGPNGERFFPVELERLVEIVKIFENRGILVKDLDSGLIDFPHFLSNGEEVYLCWKRGEETILFWHRIGDGFAGRRPVGSL
jgi:hypothetical protein